MSIFSVNFLKHECIYVISVQNNYIDYEMIINYPTYINHTLQIFYAKIKVFTPSLFNNDIMFEKFLYNS